MLLRATPESLPKWRGLWHASRPTVLVGATQHGPLEGPESPAGVLSEVGGTAVAVVAQLSPGALAHAGSAG